MPSLEMLKRMNGFATTNGEYRKNQSLNIINDTWDNDIASKVGYLYDWYHDNNKTLLNDTHAHDDVDKVPIDIKYIIASTQTYDKDTITYHIQLRPHQECNVEYFDSVFKNIYHNDFPTGLYIDIPDVEGRYNRWLIVGLANSNDAMFPTYQILRCDYVFQWIFNGIKYYMAGVLRSQNS